MWTSRLNKAIGLLLARRPTVRGSPQPAASSRRDRSSPRAGSREAPLIKVLVGIVILALVLLWALLRLRKGTRPDLPGAPQP